MGVDGYKTDTGIDKGGHFKEETRLNDVLVFHLELKTFFFFISKTTLENCE